MNITTIQTDIACEDMSMNYQKAIEIPLTANVRQTDHRVSLEEETQCPSYGLLRKSVTAFALSLKFLMAAPVS